MKIIPPNPPLLRSRAGIWRQIKCKVSLLCCVLLFLFELVVLDLDTNDSQMVGSLPIKIKKIEPPKPLPLSLATYVGQDTRPETVEPAAPSTVDGKKQSTSSIRKAVYLEKDRVRAIDPGPLDVVVEDDEVEDDEVIADAHEEGEKARLQALRILQTRSDLPEEGMWRSLA